MESVKAAVDTGKRASVLAEDKDGFPRGTAFERDLKIEESCRVLKATADDVTTYRKF